MSAAHPVPASSAVTTLEQLIDRARELASRPGRTLLGIAGAPGAGKSTLCAALERALGEGVVVVVGMDGYHLDDGVLEALGRRRRKGAPDTFDVDGYVCLLERLRRAREDVTYAPRFDRDLEASRGSAVPVPRAVPLIVTEGNYLLHDDGGWERVRELLDEVWYLDVPHEERARRLVARRLSHGDDEAHAREWVRDVDGANAAIVERCRDRADLVVSLAVV